jgi:hypothetical protein
LTGRGTFLASPGPGTYRAPSDFGYYEAQTKYMDEATRLEKLSATSKLKMYNRELGKRSNTSKTMMRHSQSQPEINPEEIPKVKT